LEKRSRNVELFFDQLPITIESATVKQQVLPTASTSPRSPPFSSPRHSPTDAKILSLSVPGDDGWVIFCRADDVIVAFMCGTWRHWQWRMFWRRMSPRVPATPD